LRTPPENRPDNRRGHSAECRDFAHLLTLKMSSKRLFKALRFYIETGTAPGWRTETPAECDNLICSGGVLA